MQLNGLFEGSGYYPFGLFRPSQNSLMRSTATVLFNQASIDQLEKVHSEALRARPGLLVVEGTSDCQGVLLRWDVASQGVRAVHVRRGGSSGPVVAKGGARGQSTIKSGEGDFYLFDASTNAVLDVEADVVPGCISPPVRPN